MAGPTNDSIWGIHSRRVLLRNRIADATVLILGEKIVDVRETNGVLAGFPIVDAGNQVLMPGLVESHAHINEPGRTEWEGFRTATEAAAAGGITTIVDMPLNSIPATTTVKALETKARTAKGQCSVDYGFWGGVIPGNAGELAGMAQAGVCGFKAFLIDSGVSEFPPVNRETLAEAMPILTRLELPLLVHAELDSGHSSSAGAEESARAYSQYLASRPRAWENDAIRLMIDLTKRHGTQVHVVHLSSADALPDIADARARGCPITVETCPHYLTFAAENVPDGATQYKCAPPIREAENREKLWRGIRDGLIELIVSDHSPCTPALKQLETGNFKTSWGGISSLQFSLSIVWTGMLERKIDLQKLARTMCEGPAKLAGLDHRKGQISAGFDADLVVFDPEQSFDLEPRLIRHRHRVTPYLGRKLFGRIEATYVRGRKIFADGQILLPSFGERLVRRQR